jgi:hypothetical protein
MTDTTMKRISVYLDDGTYRDLVELARRNGVSVSELARTTLVLVLEDDLDVIALDRRLSRGEPEAFVELGEFLTRIRGDSTEGVKS